MLKRIVVLVAFIAVTLPSGHAIKFSKEDLEALDTLKKVHTQLQKLQTEVNACLGEEKPKVFASSNNGHRLRELEMARTNPDDWPGNTFEEGFNYDISEIHELNGQLVSLSKAVLTYNNLVVNPRTQNGVGLTIRDLAQTQAFMTNLARLQASLIPLVESARKIGATYFEQLFVVNSLLKGITNENQRRIVAVHDFQAPNIQSWINTSVVESRFPCKNKLKAFTGNIHGNHSRLILFSEAASHCSLLA